MQRYHKHEVLLEFLTRINKSAQSGAFTDHNRYCPLCRSCRFDPLLNRYEAGAYTGFSPGSLAVFDSTRRYNLKPIKFENAVRYHLSSLNGFADQRIRP